MTISTDHLHSQLKSIEPDYIKVVRIQILILMALVCGLFGIVTLFNLDEWKHPVILIVLVLLFTLLAIYYPVKVFKYTRYGLLDDIFYVQKGFIFRKRTAVAQNRIQHTDVSQGPIERRYQLATLTTHTAGMKEADIQISGLKYSDAIAMRDHLLLLNKQAVTRQNTDKDIQIDDIVFVRDTALGNQSNSNSDSLQPTEFSLATSVLSLRNTEEE